MKKVFCFTAIILCFSLAGKAQIEGAYISSKGFKALGFGGFLNFSIPVSEANSIIIEAGVYTFSKDDDNVILIPLLGSYRMTLDGTGTGFYVEPTAGYTIGGSDIQKEYVGGYPVEQKVKGITGGVGAGYIFPGRVAFNIGLRYKRVFVSGDPSLNVLSLRVSHTLSFRRRDE